MQYLTYSEYLSMGGNLDSTAFTDIEYEARMKVDWYTFNRVKKDVQNNGADIPDEVKECMYHLIRLVQKQMEASGTLGDGSSSGTYGAGIRAQSNDGVSIEFNTLTAYEALNNAKEQITLAIKQGLNEVKDSLGHKLLYRGVYSDE